MQNERGRKVKSMAVEKKSWREKLLDDKGFPKVFEMDASKSKRFGVGTMVIPSPMEVDGLMRRVRKGRVTTIEQIRGVLARRHGAGMACPYTTGIFAWIAAYAAAEGEAEGKKGTTAFWRTLKTGGELNPKYPGGVALLKKKLKGEGHVVKQRGKRFFVEGFEGRLGELGE